MQRLFILNHITQPSIKEVSADHNHMSPVMSKRERLSPEAQTIKGPSNSTLQGPCNSTSRITRAFINYLRLSPSPIQEPLSR